MKKKAVVVAVVAARPLAVWSFKRDCPLLPSYKSH